MKILVQTVGTGHVDKNPVWEALAYVCKDQAPDLLLQVCSELTQRETLPRFLTACDELNYKPPADTRTLVVPDENDLGLLMAEIAGEIEKLRAEHPGAAIVVDYTSGTKAMSAGVVAAAIGRRADRFVYAVGPRDVSGRATSTDRALSVGADRVYADLLLAELGRLFDLGQFVAVREQALGLLPRLSDGALAARAASLVFLADVYDHWQRFDWDGASQRIRGHQDLKKYNQYLPPLCSATLPRDGLMVAGWNAETLGKQVPHLKHCQEGSDGVAQLVDLWANAERCLKADRYDDAVSRLYRLVEYIGQMRYCKKRSFEYRKQNPTNKVELDWLQANAPRWLDKRKERDHGKTSDHYKLGLNDAMWVLEEAGDAVAAEARRVLHLEQKKKGDLGDALDLRNNSLLAHGTNPIAREDAEKLLELTRPLLESHAKDLGKDMGTMLEVARFARCPWAAG